jgi:very-short-patch-repair endonuclease
VTATRAGRAALKPITFRDEPYAGASPKAHEIERERRAAERKKLEALMWQHLEWLNLACLFQRNAQFHPVRKWELDFLARGYSLGIEIHGGTHSGGRHVRGAGFEEDRRKMNAAIECGIRVLEYTATQVQSGEAANQVERVLAGVK